MSNPRSHLVKAMREWEQSLKPYSNMPSGMYGRSCTVKIGNAEIKSGDFDMEIEVPFDDKIEGNIAEIKIYNLSDHTINQMGYAGLVTITAGYNGDTGLIYKGTILSRKTKKEGLDKVTIVKARESLAPQDDQIYEFTFEAGNVTWYASGILVWLINQCPLYQDADKRSFSPQKWSNTVEGTSVRSISKFPRDWAYKDSVKVDGSLLDNIEKYAKICGVSVFPVKGILMCKHLSEVSDVVLDLNDNTGLIDSPQEFEEETTAGEFTDNIRGYTARSLLQHKVEVGARINLTSQNAKGQYLVRSGKHIITPDEAVTEIEMISEVDTTPIPQSYGRAVAVGIQYNNVDNTAR